MSDATGGAVTAGERLATGVYLVGCGGRERLSILEGDVIAVRRLGGEGYYDGDR